MSTYEEWRVTGSIEGEPYEFTWSPFRNPHLGDPEQGARGFLALIARCEREISAQADLTLHHRTVTVTEWQDADPGGAGRDQADAHDQGERRQDGEAL